MQIQKIRGGTGGCSCRDSCHCNCHWVSWGHCEAWAGGCHCYVIGWSWSCGRWVQVIVGKGQEWGWLLFLLPRKRPVIKGTIVDARDRDSCRWPVIIVNTNKCWGFWAGHCHNCWDVTDSLALMGVNEDIVMVASCLSSSYLISASILSNLGAHLISYLIYGCGLVSS